MLRGDGEATWIMVPVLLAGAPQRAKAAGRGRPKRRTPLKQPPDIHYAASQEFLPPVLRARQAPAARQRNRPPPHCLNRSP